MVCQEGTGDLKVRETGRGCGRDPGDSSRYQPSQLPLVTLLLFPSTGEVASSVQTNFLASTSNNDDDSHDADDADDVQKGGDLTVSKPLFSLSEETFPCAYSQE